MARPGVSREQIFEVAQRLHDAGTTPTVQTVREALGAGSFTTITSHLREWRSQQASAAADPVSLPEEVEAAAVRAAGAIWQAAEQLARREIDAARLVATAQVDEARAQAQESLQEVVRLEAEGEALRGQLADQAAVLDRVRGDFAKAQASLSAEHARSAALAGRVDELKLELAEVRGINEQRAGIIGKLEAELTAVRSEVTRLQAEQGRGKK